MTLHIASTEMMLWKLGGFAEVPPRNEPTLLSPFQIYMIRKLAAKPACERGEVRDCAHLLGMRRNTLSVEIYRVRRGYSPAYWE